MEWLAALYIIPCPLVSAARFGDAMAQIVPECNMLPPGWFLVRVYLEVSYLFVQT